MIDFDSYNIRASKISAPVFVEDEIKLKELYLERVNELYDEAEKIYEQEAEDQTFSEEKAAAILVIIYLLLRKVHGSEFDDQVQAIVNNSIKLGADVTGAYPVLQHVSQVELVSKTIFETTKHFADLFLDTVVVPRLDEAIQKVLEKEITSREAFSEILAVLKENYTDADHWELTANAATSRAYHYGLLKGGHTVGYQTVRYVAVMDDRTSQICRQLNGMEWELKVMLDIMEETARSDNPEDVKTLQPWIQAKDYLQLSPQEMADMGVIVPPRHARCRSTIEVF